MKTIEEKAREYAIETFREYLREEHSTGGKLRDAIATGYLAGAREALQGQWRSVEDELPEPNTVCLCRYRMDDGFEPSYFTAMFLGIEEWEDGRTKEVYTIPNWLKDFDETSPAQYGDEITHWLPIPEPPKDERE